VLRLGLYVSFPAPLNLLMSASGGTEAAEYWNLQVGVESIQLKNIYGFARCLSAGVPGSDVHPSRAGGNLLPLIAAGREHGMAAVRLRLSGLGFDGSDGVCTGWYFGGSKWQPHASINGAAGA
jgi:hypothetical protein